MGERLSAMDKLQTEHQSLSPHPLDDVGIAIRHRHESSLELAALAADFPEEHVVILGQAIQNGQTNSAAKGVAGKGGRMFEAKVLTVDIFFTQHSANGDESAPRALATTKQSG